MVMFWNNLCRAVLKSTTLSLLEVWTSLCKTFIHAIPCCLFLSRLTSSLTSSSFMSRFLFPLFSFLISSQFLSAFSSLLTPFPLNSSSTHLLFSVLFVEVCWLKPPLRGLMVLWFCVSVFSEGHL